jgi:hypothetical protein
MTAKQRQKWHEKIRAGVRAGIADGLEEHRRAGRKVPVWHDGKVVWMSVARALAAAREVSLRRA